MCQAGLALTQLAWGANLTRRKRLSRWKSDDTGRTLRRREILTSAGAYQYCVSERERGGNLTVHFTNLLLFQYK